MTTIKCPNCAHAFSLAERARPAEKASPNPPKLMRELQQLKGKGLTTVRIAERIGQQQPYVSKLLTIAKRVNAVVLKKWEAAWDSSRSDEPRVSVADMVALGAKKEREELDAKAQMDEYKRLVARAGLTKTHVLNQRALSRRKIPRGPR